MEHIGFGIMGAGMIAEYHRQAIKANADLGARLVAVSDYDTARFQQIEERFGVPCLSCDDLLARRDVDVVCICTPSGYHAEQTITAARAGKHVLVEKPMALTVADADAAIAACENARVCLGVVLQRRAHPIFRSVRQAIEAGDLGRLTLGMVTIPYHRSAAYYAQAAWRGTWALDGGGVLMNQGIHLVDLLVWYMGDPVRISAYATRLKHAIEVEDTLVAAWQFAGGSMATITATTTAEPGFPHRVEIYGSRGGIQIEGETLLRWTTSGSTQTSHPEPTPYQLAPAGAGGDPRGISPQGHISIVRDFIEAVRSGRPPLADGREGRRSVAAICATYEAAGLRPPRVHTTNPFVV